MLDDDDIGDEAIETTLPTSFEMNTASLRPNTEATWTAPKELDIQIIIKLAEEPVIVANVTIQGNVDRVTVGYKMSANIDTDFVDVMDMAVPMVINFECLHCYLCIHSTRILIVRPQVFESDSTGTVTVTMKQNFRAQSLNIKPITDEESPDDTEIEGIEIFGCFREVFWTEEGTTTGTRTTEATPTTTVGKS